jgi:hypothetical protein
MFANVVEVHWREGDVAGRQGMAMLHGESHATDYILLFIGSMDEVYRMAAHVRPLVDARRMADEALGLKSP